MKYKYKIYSPGGNDTALVIGIPTKVRRKNINNQIMKRWPNVEQVGFLDIKNKVLEMAGGEFCGNATRCATFEILRGYSGTIDIKVSGVASRIKAGISNYATWTQIPIYEDIKILTKTKYGYIVPMQGITHVVTAQRFTKGKIKSQALNILEKLNLMTNNPAAGVMFVSNTKNGIRLDPVVWVKYINTLFYETACASGTAAVGLVESKKSDKSTENLSIIQPSGKVLYTSTRISKNLISESLISGEITKLTDQQIITIS